MLPKLRCNFVSDLDVLKTDTNNNKKTVWLSPDNDKGTSFSIDETIGDSLKEVPKPCFLVIDCYHEGSGGTIPFFYGGMELISNSRNIESYALDPDKGNVVPTSNNLGEYWQTHQGTKQDDNISSEYTKEFYKCIILPPSSKPLSIKCLTLKLLSLRPVKCNIGYIKQIKIKAKLPDVNDTTICSDDIGEDIPDTGKKDRLQSVQPTNTTIDSIQDQIPNAIRALTAMIESVRNSIGISASNTLGEIEKKAFAKDQQNGVIMKSIQKSLGDLKDSVGELTNEIRLFRNQEEQRIQRNVIDNELEDDRLAKMRDDFQAILEEDRKQMMEEIMKQQEKFFGQIVTQFDFRSENQEVSKSFEIEKEECNLIDSLSESASCDLGDE